MWRIWCELTVRCNDRLRTHTMKNDARISHGVHFSKIKKPYLVQFSMDSGEPLLSTIGRVTPLSTFLLSQGIVSKVWWCYLLQGLNTSQTDRQIDGKAWFVLAARSNGLRPPSLPLPLQNYRQLYFIIIWVNFHPNPPSPSPLTTWIHTAVHYRKAYL